MRYPKSLAHHGYLDYAGVAQGSSRGGGPPNLYWQAADNTGVVERLTTSPNQQTPTSISPDGKHVAFVEVSPKTGQDIAVLTLGDKPSTDLLVHTPFREYNPEFSSDGRDRLRVE